VVVLATTVALWMLLGLQPATAQTSTTTASAQAVNGQLRVGDEPVEGAEIVATGADGTEAGSATSDEDGRWEIPIAAPGDYVITIDESTLPDNIELLDPEREVIAQIRPDEPRTVIIALTEEGGDGPAQAGTGSRPPSTLEQVPERLVNGVKIGLLIAMCAVGLSLTFGTTGLVNFAHGELVTLGAVAAWYLSSRGFELPLLAAGALALVIGGIAGAGVDLLMWRPLRERGTGLIQLMVVTIGLSLVARHLILIFFGSQRLPFREYGIQEKWDLGPIELTPRDLIIMVAAAVLLVLVALLLQRTRIGRAMRAVSDSNDLAETSGIDVRRVVLVVWILGAVLAALGGIFLGATEAVDWQMGFRLLLLMFAAVILGGLGSAYGAMVGGLAVGLVTELSTLWLTTELKIAAALLVLILVLLLRPQGFLGIKERVG